MHVCVCGYTSVLSLTSCTIQYFLLSYIKYNVIFCNVCIHDICTLPDCVYIPLVRYVCDSDREVLGGVSPENGTIICNEICDVIAYQEQNILQPADCELVPCIYVCE